MTPRKLQEKLIKEIQDFKSQMKVKEDDIGKIARKMHVKQDKLRECANEETAGGFQKMKDALREIFPNHSRHFKDNEVEFVDLSGEHPFSMVQLSRTDDFNTGFYVMIGVNSHISNYIRLNADSRNLDDLITEVKDLVVKFSRDSVEVI